MITAGNWQLFWVFNIFMVPLFVSGLYLILVTRNMMRTLIGIELLMKAVTLMIITAGYVTGNIALAQALAITLIVIEVIVIAVACGVVLSIYRYHGSLDTGNIQSMKG